MNNMTMGRNARVNQAMARAAVEEHIELDRRPSRVACVYGLGVVVALVVAGLLALMAAALSGCAAVPTRFDDALFTRSNAPVVTTAWTTNVVRVTNTVEQVVQVVQTNTVTVTNTVAAPGGGSATQVELRYVMVTNTVTVQTPVVSLQTNALPPGSTVEVPQLVGLKPGAEAGSGFISGVAGLFGYGGIASLVLSGLAHGYQGFRNRQLAAAATGASAAQEVTEQAAGVLTQNIETLLAVLQGSPQGQALMPTIKNYLMSHQTTTGTIATIGGLVEQYVNEPAAQGAAASILGALTALSGGLPGRGNVPAGAVPVPSAAPKVGV